MIGEALDNTIRRMWPDASASAIAGVAGVECSTVTRRARAMGLPSKARMVIKPPPAAKPAARPVSGGNLKRKLEARADAFPRLEYAPLPPVRPAGPNARTLADAPARGACRFPVGEAPEGRPDLQLFCCEPVQAAGCPYCGDHAALAYLRRRK